MKAPRLVATALLATALLSTPARAHPPRGIVVDAAGQVYFSSLETVWRIDARGRLTSLRTQRDRHTHELAIDSRGDLYGEDSLYDPATQVYRAAIWRITAQGRFTYLLAPTAAIPLGISIWRDTAERTYLVQSERMSDETLMFRRDPDGRVTRLLGGAAAARFQQVLASNVSGSSFGPGGAFWFRHGAVLRKLTPQGGLVTLARDLPAENFGIAVDGVGAVFVTDFAGRRVLKLAPDGRRTVAARAEGSWAPTGVAVHPAALYVLESRQDARGVSLELRVRRVPSRGRPVVLARVPVG